MLEHAILLLLNSQLAPSKLWSCRSSSNDLIGILFCMLAVPNPHGQSDVLKNWLSVKTVSC